MPETFNIHEAKTHFSRLVERAEHGERITIARAAVPVAMLVAIEPADPAGGPIGMDRGRIVIHEDFDEPLPEFDITICEDPDGSAGVGSPMSDPPRHPCTFRGQPKATDACPRRRGAIIEDGGHGVLFSAVSAMEIAMKHARWPTATSPDR